MTEAIKKKVKKNGRIFMVHCTSYSDDRQVMQFMGDRLEKEGYEIIYGTADNVNFKDQKAYSILERNFLFGKRDTSTERLIKMLRR